MPLDETLRKVDYDLLQGNRQRAVQRLTGLLWYRAYPGNLQVRRRLGDLHWQAGNMIEAGRYWYLESAKTAEMQAVCARFETACGHRAQRILQRLRFQGDLQVLRHEHPDAFATLNSLMERTWMEFDYTDAYPIPAIDHAEASQSGYTHHILILDENGWLGTVPLGLTRRWNAFDCTLTVLSSSEPQLAALQQSEAARNWTVVSYGVDFNDFDQVASILRTAVAQRNLFDYALVAVRSLSLPVLYALFAELTTGLVDRILDSSAADPNNLKTIHDERKILMALLPPFRYREIIIGFVLEPQGSRWLIVDEIQTGVSRIARHCSRPGNRMILGTLRPWEARPLPVNKGT